MKQLMSQQPHSSTVSDKQANQEANEARKIRIDKNRAIRKSKVISRNNEINQDIIVPLTRQEKAQLQKVKNRQAAQKSRQQKKYYLQSLQKQIKELQQKLSKPAYCQRCKTQIGLQNNHLEEQERGYELPLDYSEEQSPFRRVHNDQSSPIGHYLFICMIVVCIFSFQLYPTSEPNSFPLLPGRDLTTLSFKDINSDLNGNLQVGLVPNNKANNHIMKKDLAIGTSQQHFQSNSQNQNGLILFETGLAKPHPFTHRNCIQQIIERNKQHLKKDMKFIPHLRKSQKSQNIDSNLLFCQIPRVYRSNDIIVSGDQMMQIIEDQQNYAMKQILDVDGIYQLKTEVKQIIKLDQSLNCLI